MRPARLDPRGLARSRRIRFGATPGLGAVHLESGDRYWGQVRGFSGRLKALRGRDASDRRSGVVTGKTPQQALFLSPSPAARILHGKEGVDGSSPSEGSSKRKIPGHRGFLLSNQHHRAPPHYRREGYSARCAAAKPLQIDLLPGTWEHLPKREGIRSRVARRGLPRTAWTSAM